MKKFLKVSRVLLGNVCLALLLCGVIARFTVSYNESINPKYLSGVMLKISFILFSVNMMITIILDTKFKPKHNPAC